MTYFVQLSKYPIGFSFLWPCIVSRVWREKTQQDATIRCLLLTSVSTCFGHHYAHLQENREPVTAYGVLFWFCWMWLVAVVGRCVVGCEQFTGYENLMNSYRNLWEHHALGNWAEGLGYSSVIYLSNLMHKICFTISFISLLVHKTATYRCDDTRGCVMQFLPPDDEHICSKHVEAWNKTDCETHFVHQVG